jgi:hypothetical protein
VEWYQDPSDTSYSFFVFKIPETSISDLQRVMQEDYDGLSSGYKQSLYATHPRLHLKLDSIFKKKVSMKDGLLWEM